MGTMHTDFSRIEVGWEVLRGDFIIVQGKLAPGENRTVNVPLREYRYEYQLQAAVDYLRDFSTKQPQYDGTGTYYAANLKGSHLWGCWYQEKDVPLEILGANASTAPRENSPTAESDGMAQWQKDYLHRHYGGDLAAVPAMGLFKRDGKLVHDLVHREGPAVTMDVAQSPSYSVIRSKVKFLTTRDLIDVGGPKIRAGAVGMWDQYTGKVHFRGRDAIPVEKNTVVVDIDRIAANPPGWVNLVDVEEGVLIDR